MTDVIAEMVMNPIGAGDQVVDKEIDTDACVMDEPFQLARKALCDSTNELRAPLHLICIFLRWGSLWLALGWPAICFARGKGGEEGRSDDLWTDVPSSGDTAGSTINSKVLLDILYLVAMGFFYFFTSFYPAELAAVLHPETGALVELGNGRKTVSASDYKAVKRQRWPLLALAVPTAVYGFFGVTVFPIFFFGKMVPSTLECDDEAKSQRFHDVLRHVDTFRDTCFDVALGLYAAKFWEVMMLGFSFCIGLPTFALWYQAMTVAAVLAKDDVLELQKKVSIDVVTSDDDAWTKQVVQPTIELEQRTMKQLSGGFGRGTGIAALLCLMLSFGQMIKMLTLVAVGHDTGHVDNPYMAALW